MTVRPMRAAVRGWTGSRLRGAGAAGFFRGVPVPADFGFFRERRTAWTEENPSMTVAGRFATQVLHEKRRAPAESRRPAKGVDR
jgi:hypothetical protein